MSNTDQAPEPTMDEILASIRRIISDEPTDNQKQSDGDKDSVADDIARALNFDAGEEPGVSGMDDDILELTEIVPRDTPADDKYAGFGSGAMNETLTPADSVAPAPMEFNTSAPAFDDEEDFSQHPSQALGVDDNPDDVFATSDALENPAEYSSSDDDMSAFDAADPAGINSEAVAGLDVSAFEDQSLFADGGGDGLRNPGLASEDAFQNEVADKSEENASHPGVHQEEKQAAANNAVSAEQPPELGEALSWDSLEEELGQDIHPEVSDTALEQDVDAAESMGSFEQASATPETADDIETAAENLVEDENVTFGQLSPEENLESALEKAISDIDPEAGWDDRAEGAGEEEDIEQANKDIAAEVSAIEQDTPDNIEEDRALSEIDTDTESAEKEEKIAEAADQSGEEAVEATEEVPPVDEDEAGWTDKEEDAQFAAPVEEEDKADTQVQEGMSEDMALSEAAAQQSGRDDELADTLSAVKETVAREISAIGQAEANNMEANIREAQDEPQISEVVPVQQQSTAPSPLQQQTAAAVSPLEESIKDMLKPMLREWLDDNMPRLLEGAMKEQQKTDQKK